MEEDAPSSDIFQLVSRLMADAQEESQFRQGEPIIPVTVATTNSVTSTTSDQR